MEEIEAALREQDYFLAAQLLNTNADVDAQEVSVEIRANLPEEERLPWDFVDLVHWCVSHFGQSPTSNTPVIRLVPPSPLEPELQNLLHEAHAARLTGFMEQVVGSVSTSSEEEGSVLFPSHLRQTSRSDFHTDLQPIKCWSFQSALSTARNAAEPTILTDASLWSSRVPDGVLPLAQHNHPGSIEFLVCTGPCKGRLGLVGDDGEDFVVELTSASFGSPRENIWDAFLLFFLTRSFQKQPLDFPPRFRRLIHNTPGDGVTTR